MEVQEGQPEVKVMASGMTVLFMACGVILLLIAYFVSQSFRYQYSGSSAMLMPALLMGGAMIVRGLFHALVPLARFSENTLYLRPTPLVGCHEIAYSLIDDYVIEDKKLVISYRAVDAPEGAAKKATIKSHQVGRDAFDQLTQGLTQRIR